MKTIEAEHIAGSELGSASRLSDSPASLPPIDASSEAVVSPAALRTALGRAEWREYAYAWLPVFCVLIAVGHVWVGSELELALLTLSPLLLIPFTRGKPSAFVYVGLASLLLAAADLVHTIPRTNTTWWTSAAPHRALTLLVLCWVLLRMRRAYVGVVELSRRDPLTGLLNRRGFEELAARELERAQRYGRTVAFALLDLDRFKQINDRFGHAQGDALLQTVGIELARLRGSDLAVRLGGDEFGLLMPETDEAAAGRVVARLEERVHERLQARGWTLGMSVGIVAGQGSALSITQLLAEADRRMYLNKPSTQH